MARKAPIKIPVFKDILQAGFITGDIFSPVKIFSDFFGIGPWSIYEFNPSVIENMVVQGKPLAYHAQVAICKIGDFGLEFIKPLDHKGIYWDFLEKKGEGFHHVAYDAGDYFDALSYFTSKNFAIYQSGSWFGKHIYTYFNTWADLKHIVEIYRKAPDFSKYVVNNYGMARRIFPVPDYTYPGEAAFKKMMKPQFKRVMEIGLVVENLAKTIKSYQVKFGIGPWHKMEIDSGSISEMRVYGQRQDYRAISGNCKIGNVNLELIQPLDENSIYSMFLESKGEGLHHIGYEAGSLEKIASYFNHAGMKECQSGTVKGKDKFIYYQSQEKLKHIMKIYEIL